MLQLQLQQTARQVDFFSSPYDPYVFLKEIVFRTRPLPLHLTNHKGRTRPMSFHKHIQLAGTVTVGPKGQVVIPSDVRDQMEIQPGDKLVALYFDEKKSVAFITEAQAQDYVVQMGEHCTYFKENIKGE